jgi:hypothetical protein
LSLLNSISHELRDWVESQSRVQAVLAQRPATTKRAAHSP